MDDVKVPKGFTLVDPSKAPSGADASPVKVPKGFTLVGAQKPKETPKFGPQVSSQSQPQEQPKNVPAGFIVTPKAAAVSDSHVDTFMAGIRKPADYRQYLYDSTVKEGYTPAQVQKRQQEYDHAISQGMSPENAYDLAQGVRFDAGEKHVLTDAEKVTTQAQFKDYALKQQQLNAAHGREVSIPEKMVGTTPEDAEKWAQASARRYAYARAHGKTENEAQSFAKGVLPQWFDKALETTGLNSEHSWILSDKGERNTRYAVGKWADWLEKDHPTVGPYIGEIAKGLTDFGIGLTTPSMVAIGVGASVTDGFSEIAPWARGAEAGEEAAEAEKATSLAGRWRRAVGKVRDAAAKKAAQAPGAVGRQAGKAFGQLAPGEAAEASKVVGTAAENVEKATQAIQDAKLPVSAVKVARTMRDATHAYFSYQMAQGAVEGVKQSAEYAEKGDYPHAVSAFVVNVLVGGWMAYGSGEGVVEREMFKAKADDMTARVYGTPAEVEGEGPKQKGVTKFGDLNDYQQAVVLTKLIEEDPTYNHRWVETKAEHDRRMKKLAYRYSASLKQAWNPDAVKRMVRVIDTHRAVNEWYDARQKMEDTVRDHYLKQIATLIDLHKQDKADEEELAAAETERRASAKEGRPVRKTEAAKKREESRKVTLTTAGQIAEARQGVTAAREAVDRETAEQETQAAEKAPQGPVQQPDVTTDDQGYVTYRGRAFGGEDHFFGIARNAEGQYGVYRKTPDGIEYLGAGGIFEQNPEQTYVAPSEESARTLAQITSLRVNADYALEEHGSTPEREAERTQLRNLERQLVDGEVTPEQARQTARLPEEETEKPPKATVDQEIAAARAGALNGPLHGRTRAQYEDDFLAGLEEAGWAPEEIEAAIDTMGINLRMEAENNLHYVGKSGDWIASKKGATWVLDDRGMLHADDNLSAPIPLMKNGRYSAQAIDLALSGRVGFGQRSFEETKVESAKERLAEQQLENLTQAVADEVQSSIERGKQLVGLQLEAGELPQERTAPERRRAMTRPPSEPTMVSPERETERAVQEGYAASKEAQKAEDAVWINAIGDYLAQNSESAWSLIQRVAKNSGLSPQEVLRLQLERLTPPDTLEGKIERLKAGDIINDKIGLPWVVKVDKNGTLYLRKGDGARVHINKFKPSDDVRRIVGTGEIEPAPGPRYTPEDVRRAAYEAPYVARRVEAVEEVKARAAGEVKDPEPRTPEQAEHQAQAAQVRAEEVKGAAIVETVKASDPAPGTSLPEAEAAVDKAEEGVQTAEQAAWQGIEAKAKTVSDQPFPPRAPITMGPQYVGNAGVIKHLGQTFNFHYALVPDDQIVNSHVWDGNVLKPNEEYDEDLQPRTISEARSSEIVLEAQIRQSDDSKGFDFDYFGDKTISPLTGPPILEMGGRNAGGNTRLAILRKHLEIIRQIADIDEREVALMSFRAQMAQLAREVRIAGRVPENGRDYIVVRVLDDPITTRRDAATKGLVFNTSPSQDIGEAARGVALAKQLSDQTLEDIGRMLDQHDTLGAAIARNPQVFTDIVTNELGVASTEHPLWFNETGNGKVLSESGRRKFMQVLMGRILDDTSVMDILQRDDPTGYTAIERAVINIVRMKATKNEPIVAKIIEAIHASATTASTGIAGEGIVDRWAATYDPQAIPFDFAATEAPKMPDKVIEAIWRAIHAGPRTLSDRVKAYNETDRPSKSTGLDFTGAFEAEKQKLETPTELFNRVFAKEINKAGVGKKRDVITEAEYNAAMENRGNLSDRVVEEAKRTEKGLPAEKRRPETAALRKRIDQMSEAEKTAALLTSRKTALPNMTDFEEHNDPKVGGAPAPVIGMSDVDGLKAFNDKYGYAAGDKLLRAKADALRQVGVEAYHDKGDEFVYRAQTPDELRSKLDQARQILRDTPIEVTKNGKTEIYRGVDFSFGIGKDLDEAKEGQNTAKSERTAKGERKRGEFGNIKAAPEKADTTIATAKAEKGYVTPDELQTFLESHPATEAHASEYMRTAQIMAQSFWDIRTPDGIERKHALEWVLKESGFKGIEKGDRADVKGEYDFATGILRLHEAADETTFMHEFAHVISPMLSDADWKAIDTIKVDKTAYKRQWGKEWKYSGKSERQEKLAYGLEQFLRDENPTNFHLGYEARGVLEKIKEMFVSVYQKLLPGDPLSPFKLSEEAREFFSRTLGIEGMDLRDDWNEKVKAARKEEIKQKKGIVLPIPELTKKIKDFGPSPTHVQRYMDADVDSQEGRVDVSKTKRLVAVQYADEADAVHAFINAREKGVGVQLLRGKNGEWGIQFNTEEDVPDSVLYQEVPKPKQEGLRLEDLEAKLKTTASPILQKFLKTQIERLKAEIRNEPRPQAVPGLAKQAVAEVKRGTEGRTAGQGRERVSDLRGVPDGPSRDGQKGIGRLSRPPIMGMPGHAGARGAGNRGGTGGGERPVDLATVAPVNVVPMPERTAAPVGTLAGDNFDPKAWDEACQKAGLPRLPYPTKVLSRQVAQILGKYGGEIQSAQTLLTALSNGDGAVLASVPGSGKTWVLSGVVQETLLNNPDAKILFITKNRKLLKDAAGVMSDGYGLEMETDHLKGKADKNIYGATYARFRSNELYKKTQWDLVIADESGEARNWHQPQKEVKAGEKPKVHQGILLKQVMDNAKKGIYSSATPFLSPMDYGYLDKLNLWPKGEFDEWVKNFKHETVGGKTVSQLDPVKQAKMRQQLIERGQFISQKISYDGYTIHFGVVPVTDLVERKLDRIHQGIAVMRRELLKQGKKGLSEKVAAFEATYTKAFLDRSRADEIIQLAKQGREQGWRVAVMSETTSEDLFRKPIEEGGKMGTYRQLDEDTGGQISRIMPEFGNMADTLRAEFGDEIGDYSGIGNTDAQREAALDDFRNGKKPMLYMSYASGGIGVNPQDKIGDKPTLVIYTGPPYSGYLLDQALGRFWRFDTKSNVHAIILATDAEPDVRMMATKIAPRMEALGAAVNGHRDALSQVMANYTDEQKMREHQDMLAFDQGNEVKVDAQGYQVRSKRKVNFDNWSSIRIPSAEEAKNKGMKTEGFGGKGSDWATLYQEKPRRWEPPNRPLTIEDIRIRRAVNAAADKAAQNPQIPSGEIAMSAVRAEEVAKAAPEGVDKEAAARDAVGGHLKGIGYVQDPLTGEWKTPEQIEAATPKGEVEEKYKAALGMTSSLEQNLIYMDRQMHTGGAGRELVTKTRRYSAMIQRELADRRTDFTKIMQDNHLKPQDDQVMRDIFDVVMGKRTVADPAINNAAGEVSAMMARIHQKGAAGNLKVRTPDGRLIPWSDFQDDPSYMPRIADWNAKFSDGEHTYTLKEIMGGTFGEVKAKELIAKKLREEGRTDITAERAYDLIKRERLRSPVQGNIQRTNEQNFPFIRKDYGALDNYFKQFAKAMATESEFGADLGKLKREINKIPNKQARTDVEAMFGYMFTPQYWDSDLGRLYNTAAAMETATKMTFSASKVLFHAFNAPMVMGGKVMPIVKAVGHLAGDWKKTRENGYYIGTVMHGIDPAVMYMPETKTQHALFKYTGFEYLYNLGRSIAGESARVYLDQYAMDDLKKGGNTEANARRLLKNTFLIGDHAIDLAKQTGKWDPEDYKLAQVAFTNESLYGDSPLQMPSLARQRIAGEGLSTGTKRLHMALRASYSLQSFHTKTYSMLREHLWDEVMVYHNYKPLAYAMVVAPVIGQILQGASSGVKSGVHRVAQFGAGKPHTEDSWDKWIAQFTDVKHKGAMAFLKLYIDGICSQWALEREKRLADALFNLTIDNKDNQKSAAATGRYLLNDEIEESIGPIWADTVMKPIEFTGQEIEAAAGKPGTFVPRTEKNVVRNLEELSPLLRQEPHVEEFLSPKKKKTTWQVP